VALGSIPPHGSLTYRCEHTRPAAGVRPYSLITAAKCDYEPYSSH
jgi:hypothetical protein